MGFVSRRRPAGAPVHDSLESAGVKLRERTEVVK
jgi:hypothetical protein